MYCLPQRLTNAVKALLSEGTGTNTWNADHNRYLAAVFSLEKISIFLTSKNTQLSCSFEVTSGRGTLPRISRQQEEEIPSAGERIISSSKAGGWTYFELFGIQSGDKNTLAR